jgi:nicotinamidase-related amidase
VQRRSVLKAGLGVAASSMASALAAAAPAAATRHESGSGPTADFPVIPLRTALINVDMQNCFVEGHPVSAPEGPRVLNRINRLAAACRAAGILVIHTAHVLRADGSNAGVMSEFIPAIRAGMINKGSQASALHKSLVVDPRDILLEKPRFGAFQGTDLELILRSHDVNSVIIGGIATNVCCETTARGGNARLSRLLPERRNGDLRSRRRSGAAVAGRYVRKSRSLRSGAGRRADHRQDRRRPRATGMS